MEERGKSSRFRSPAAFAVASIASASAYLWVRIPVGRGSLTRFQISNDVIKLHELPAGDDVD